MLKQYSAAPRPPATPEPDQRSGFVLLVNWRISFATKATPMWRAVRYNRIPAVAVMMQMLLTKRSSANCPAPMLLHQDGAFCLL